MDSEQQRKKKKKENKVKHDVEGHNKFTVSDEKVEETEIADCSERKSKKKHKRDKKSDRGRKQQKSVVIVR